MSIPNQSLMQSIAPSSTFSRLDSTYDQQKTMQQNGGKSKMTTIPKKTRRKKKKALTTIDTMCTVDDEEEVQLKKKPSATRQSPVRKPSNTAIEGGEKPAAAEPVAPAVSKVVRMALTPSCDEIINGFVNHVSRLGVDGLRKLYREQIVPLCPPTSKCTAFDENPTKNRYPDVVCLEHTRVKLTHDVPPSSDYIHANWVKFPKHDRTFIAAQGPMDETIEDFWRMIFQEQCPIIINLTKFEEGGREKCAHYWPEKVGQYRTYGKMFINNKKFDDDDKYNVHTLEVLPDGCSNAHMVKLIHLQCWPDHGVPMSGKVVLRMLRMIVKVDAHASGPVVTHCSAGISRTGSIILIDVMLQRLFKNAIPIDFVALVTELRQQRASCLQNEAQFVFAVASVLEYVRARIPGRFKRECTTFAQEFRESGLQNC